MRTQAAVLYEAGTDWKVEDVELDPPRAGELLVRQPRDCATRRSITGSATCRSPGR
jgi:Zn-dependent alcohol dehydrogenase